MMVCVHYKTTPPIQRFSIYAKHAKEPSVTLCENCYGIIRKESKEIYLSKQDILDLLKGTRHKDLFIEVKKW